MHKKWLKRLMPILVGCGSLFFCLSVSANEGNPAAELTALLENMKTLQANYSQKIRDNQNHRVSESTGQMHVSRPNQFLWKSDTPDPIQVIADGHFLWTYDVDLAQVTKQNLAKALKNSPAAFLAGSTSELTHQYHVAYAKTADCPKGTDRSFELKSKQSDSPLVSMVLSFNQNKLVQMRMKDALGQDIRTVFTEVKINEPINQKLFSFTPPKGVDVLSPEK